MSTNIVSINKLKSTPEQMKLLIHETMGPEGSINWESVTERLNAIGPPVRTRENWRRVYKYYTKRKQNNNDNVLTKNPPTENVEPSAANLPEYRISYRYTEDHTDENMPLSCTPSYDENILKSVQISNNNNSNRTTTEKSFQELPSNSSLKKEKDVKCELSALKQKIFGKDINIDELIEETCKNLKNYISSMEALVTDGVRFSTELLYTLKSINNFWQIQNYQKYVSELTENNFKDCNKRGGIPKRSYIYILIDSGKSGNLNTRAENLNEFEIWKTFLLSIFYVGKGKGDRPYDHLGEAKNYIKSHSESMESETMDGNKKIDRILNIWKQGNGIICLQVFHNIHDNDAFTREAAIIDALGLGTLTNYVPGKYYGNVKTWPDEKKKQLGIALLYNAMHIYLKDGQSAIFQGDLDFS